MSGKRLFQALSALAVWAQDNIAAGQAEAAMPLGAQPLVTDLPFPTNGEVFGLGVSLSDLITAGDISVRASISGTPLTTQQVVTAASGSDIFFRVTDANRFFVAGQRLEILLDSDAALLPLTIDVAVVAYVVFNRGVGVSGDQI